MFSFQTVKQKYPGKRNKKNSPSFCRFYALSFLASLFCCLALAGCGNTNGYQSDVEIYSWPAMGTDISISLCEQEMLKKEELFKRIKKRISLLENILSSHLPDSELEKLNNSPVSRKMTVPTELYDAVNAGIAWNIKTSGAFDITAGPLITLWKNAGKTGHVPTDREIESAMKNTGIDKIVLERSDFSIMKTVNVSIDLGGLGKGFTADDIAGLLKENGQESALIAMSGDIRAVGRRPDGRLWRVGVQDPRYPENLNALVTIVEISNRAVSTSGNYRRFVEINGKRYSHIIDPRTGRTADNVPSVSVIGPDTLTTDIMGTALSVLGVKEGVKLVESMPGIEALFMEVSDEGELILTRSSGFARYEVPHDNEKSVNRH